MKCGLCKATLKGKGDLANHAGAKHKLTLTQYWTAVKAVAPALAGIAMFNGALKKAGMLALVVMTLGGCRGLDRLLGNDKESPSAPPAPARALGAWSGDGTLSGDITINGHACTLSMNIPTQAGAAVSGTWVITIPNSNQPGGPPDFPAAQGTVEGTIDAAGAFTYTLTESPTCANQGHGTGRITGDTLAVTFTGQTGCNLWFDGGSGTLTR